MRTAPIQSQVGTTSSVTSSATVVPILAANPARLGACVFNDSAQPLSIKCGLAATATDFTIKIATGGFWLVPCGYTGVLTGLWASADGAARVTEFS